MAELGFTRPATDPAADPDKVGDGDSTVSRADPIGVGGEAQDNMDAAQPGDVTTPRGLEHLSRTDAIQVQFPSLAGQPNVEVAERSADVTKSATKQHRKVFVLFTDGFPIGADFDHHPNFTATRQYMLDHGLRPVGDVTYVGAESVDERNTALTYQVEALPAAVAVDPDTAHMIVPQD